MLCSRPTSPCCSPSPNRNGSGSSSACRKPFSSRDARQSRAAGAAAHQYHRARLRRGARRRGGRHFRGCDRIVSRQHPVAAWPARHGRHRPADMGGHGRSCRKTCWPAARMLRDSTPAILLERRQRDCTPMHKKRSHIFDLQTFLRRIQQSEGSAARSCRTAFLVHRPPPLCANTSSSTAFR